MSEYIIQDTILENIANAIREKNGTQITYYPNEMAVAIQQINTSGYPEPTGTIAITQNGTADVKDYATAAVNVSPNLQSKTATQNGTVTPDSGYDGLSSVVVDVEGPSVSDNDLLFHFNNDFNSAGRLPCLWLNRNGLEISTEQSKFGTASLKTGTTQTKNNVVLGLDFALGTGDFTLDFWCYPTNLPSSSSSFVVPIAFDYRSLAIYMSQSAIQFGISNSNGSSWYDIVTNSANISNNAWHHVAVVRNNEEIYCFLDGIKLHTVQFGSGAYATISQMTLGSNTYESGDRRFNGYIDELRLKLGEAIWTTDFTPPTQPYM